MKRFSLSVFALLYTLLGFAQAKYVFYFIGDGMGTNQILATEMYLAELEGRIGRKALRMTQFPFTGQLGTFSASNGITDSAAAGTALATGTKTKNGMLGVSADLDTLTSVAEQLQAEGYGIGIMSTVSIDHATPGSFYANVPDRGMYYEIGKQLAVSDFDYFAGAGFVEPMHPKDKKAASLRRLCEKNGYTFAAGYADAQTKLDQDKLILFPAAQVADPTLPGHNLPYTIDRPNDAPTLAEMVATAIAFLDKKEERFFIMAEGGMIDYAGHGNDGATALGEVMDFDAAIEVAYQFYLQHPDETLIVVTADHETGGMALGNSDYTLNLQLLQHQHCSAWVLSDAISSLFRGHTPSWEEVQALLTEKMGFYKEVTITAEEDAYLHSLYEKAIQHQSEEVETLYKTMGELSSAAIVLLNRKAKIGWTTNSHTAHAVPLFAIGAGAKDFAGWHDNTEVPKLIFQSTQED